MSDVTQPELLINALLDGQLDAAQAERVSQQIADDETTCCYRGIAKISAGR